MAENQINLSEQKRQIDGAPPRDLSIYSKWRATARPENLELLRIYGTWLTGQFCGMGDGVSLQAIMIALRLERVPKWRHPELAARLNLLHSIVMERLKAEK